MKIISLPTVIKALVFDIDLTLYDNQEYPKAINRLLIKRLAQEFNKPEEKMEKTITEIQETFKNNNEGRKLSLGNTFLQLGISIEQSAQWRDEFCAPEKYLQKDIKLIWTLKKLSAQYIISAVTNNPTNFGRRTLEVLGIDNYFQIIVGLEISAVSKPSITPFKIVSDKLGIPLYEMVSIGDRMEIDIELPVNNGMGGILVECLEDVYELPIVLNI